MPKMTLLQARTLTRFVKARDLARDAIYTFAKADTDTFAACYLLAPPHERRAYQEALHDLTQYERSLIRLGRGYYATSGTFTPN